MKSASLISEQELTLRTCQAAKTAFQELFQVYPGTYYYCSMFTDGLANGPAITAWSYEALEKCASEQNDPVQAKEWLKWSYGDSPFFCYRDDLFEPIRKAIQKRPGPDKEGWLEEYQLRMRIMENAMKCLDEYGVFGVGLARSQLVVAVEVVPPDSSNTERVKRLNPPDAVAIWLAEYDNS